MSTIVTREIAKKGLKVVRNPDKWAWGDQDHVAGKPSVGVVQEDAHGSYGWITVVWANGESNGYQLGRDLLVFEEDCVMTRVIIGARVKRNPKMWSWGDQDVDKTTGKQCLGTVKSSESMLGAIVVWDNGHSNSYKVGYQERDGSITNDLLVVTEPATQEETKENKMKIPMPTPSILTSLNVELQGERRSPKVGESYLEESDNEFTLVVVEATRTGGPSRWIVLPQQKKFQLNATTTVTIPTSKTADVIAVVGGGSPTTQTHSQADIKRLAKVLSLPASFHGNDLSFDTNASINIGCQKVLVSKVIELAALLPA